MSNKFTTYIRAAYAQKLLHGPQVLLLALYNKTREGRSPSDIVTMTGMEMATVSMAKKHLQKQGAIEVVFPVRDGRKAILRLSLSGLETARQMWVALRGMTKHQPAFYKVSPSLQKSRKPQTRSNHHRAD